MSIELLKDDDWLREQLSIYGTAAAVATAHNMAERTVQRYARTLKSADIRRRFGELKPTIEREDLMTEIVLHGGGTIAADWHIPATNWRTVEHMVEQAIRYDLTRYLGIPGDLFNFDSLSDYHPKQKSASLEHEFERASQVMDMLLDVFDEVVITKGNHDVRLLKALGWNMRFSHSIKMVLDVDKDKLDRVKVTGRDYFLVETPSGLWRACHTRQYSRQQLSVPSQIADIHQQHVAAAHRHHASIGRSPSGKWVVELGGMHDQDVTEYLMQYTTTYPKWAPSYLLLSDDGEPYMPMLAPVPHG